MHILVDSNQRIVQHGDHPGERDGHTVIELEGAGEDRLLEMLAQRTDGRPVIYGPDGSMTLGEPDQTYLEALAARERSVQERADDLALISQHPALPDDLKAALARLIG